MPADVAGNRVAKHLAENEPRCAAVAALGVDRDRVHLAPRGRGCTGAEIEVDSEGRFTATVEADGMLALLTGAVHSTGP
jgi:hypothetical protein